MVPTGYQDDDKVSPDNLYMFIYTSSYQVTMGQVAMGVPGMVLSNGEEGLAKSPAFLANKWMSPISNE